MATKINQLSDITVWPEDRVRAVFGAGFKNQVTGEQPLDNPIVMNYFKHFPTLSVMYDAEAEDEASQLVVCASIPNMTMLCDGNDKRKGQMTSKVNDAKLRIIDTQANTNFYELTALYEVISNVGTRGSSGKQAMRTAELAKLFATFENDLVELAKILGSAVNDFPALFVDGEPINFNDAVDEAYAIADEAYEAKKAANESEDEEE